MSGTQLQASEGVFDDLARESLRGTREVAEAYLRQWWLAGALQTLVEARRHAKLTQQQVAERLSTTQSAIARLEQDDEGRLSLRRYIDYLIACDHFPLDIEAESFLMVRQFATDHPSMERTSGNFLSWVRRKEDVTYHVVSNSNVLPGHHLLLAAQPMMKSNIAVTRVATVIDSDGGLRHPTPMRLQTNA